MQRKCRNEDDSIHPRAFHVIRHYHESKCSCRIHRYNGKPPLGRTMAGGAMRRSVKRTSGHSRRSKRTDLPVFDSWSLILQPIFESDGAPWNTDCQPAGPSSYPGQPSITAATIQVATMTIAARGLRGRCSPRPRERGIRPSHPRDQRHHQPDAERTMIRCRDSRAPE